MSLREQLQSSPLNWLTKAYQYFERSQIQLCRCTILTCLCQSCSFHLLQYMGGGFVVAAASTLLQHVELDFASTSAESTEEASTSSGAEEQQPQQPQANRRLQMGH